MSDAAEAEEQEAPAKKEGTYEFDEGFQRKIVALTLRDTVFAQRTDGLILPDYFENPIDARIVSVARDYYEKYKKAPDKGSLVQVFKKAVDDKKIPKADLPDVKKRLGELLGVSLADRDLAIDEVSGFAKHTAIQAAIMNSVGLLGKGDYAKIEQIIRQAVNVGTSDDASEYDYFAEINNRTDHRVALLTGTIKPDGITTGAEELDKLLHHHGWGRKELSAIMGRAKFGKSMALGDFGKAAAMEGYSVLIVSCEVSARIYADRLDANLTATAMNLLKQNAHDVRKKIQDAEARAAKKGGILKIHDFGSGQLKPSQLRRLIERYRTRGIIFDLIIVDYADIMCPERITGEPREDSKSIWIDLRGIAWEQNAAVLTATQTNREGAKALVAKGTDVAEDYNKTRIADLLISGNATDAEISAGECRLYFAASRNQAERMVTIGQKRDQMKFFTKVLRVA